MDPKPITCTNCQAVTTNDGRTIWVCEDCGEENTPDVVETTKPEPQIPDASLAQAAITDAAAAAGMPMEETPAASSVTSTIEPTVVSAPPASMSTEPAKPVTTPAPISGMKTIPSVEPAQPAVSVAGVVTPPSSTVVEPEVAPKKPTV